MDGLTHLGRPFGAVSSDIHLHRHHPSYLTQPHHLPHVFAPRRPFRAVRSCYTSTSSSSIHPHSPPCPPLFHVVLGRPFRAVRGTINLILPLTLTPILVNQAHGSSLHHIHHLSLLQAVDLGRQEQHYQTLLRFPFPLPLPGWGGTVQVVGPSEAQLAITVGRERTKKKKNLIASPRPLPPPPVGQREGKLPSYDSRVHGLMRLLGTSPAPSSRFLHLPLFHSFSLSVVLSACLPCSFLCLSSAAGPARCGQIQSDLAMVCLGWSTMVPALAPFSSWPRGLVRECCPAGRSWTSTSLPRTSTQRHPNTGPFLVRASRLLYENMAYRWWISWTIFASLLQCNSRRERRPLTTLPVSSSVLPSRLANGSRDTNLAFTFFSSSTSESDGQLSRPQPVLHCGILCSSVFSMCSFPSGTVAGDGAPRSLSVLCL